MIVALGSVLIVSSLLMIVLVLLHKGKGGGLSDMFGGGTSSASAVRRWPSATSTASRSSSVWSGSPRSSASG